MGKQPGRACAMQVPGGLRCAPAALRACVAVCRTCGLCRTHSHRPYVWEGGDFVSGQVRRGQFREG